MPQWEVVGIGFPLSRGSVLALYKKLAYWLTELSSWCLQLFNLVQNVFFFNDDDNVGEDDDATLSLRVHVPSVKDKAVQSPSLGLFRSWLDRPLAGRFALGML